MENSGLAGKAILLQITAILCFSLMDACVKALVPQTGVMPALWARYAGQMLMVTLLVLPRLRQVVRTTRPGTQITRFWSRWGPRCFWARRWAPGALQGLPSP